MTLLLLAGCLLLFLCDAAVSTACALWPLQTHLHKLTHLSGWQHLYSLGNSNLDVWVQSLAHCLLLLLCLLAGAQLGRGPLQATAAARCRRARRAALLLTGLCEVRSHRHALKGVSERG